MTAKGFCTCKRDFPQRRTFHPPVGATWHYLCDKPTNPADWPPALPTLACAVLHGPEGCPGYPHPRLRETGTGWPPALPELACAREPGCRCDGTGGYCAVHNNCTVSSFPLGVQPRVRETGTGWPVTP